MTVRQIAFVAALVFGLWQADNRVRAQSLTVEVLGGSAYNIPTPLTVRQSGYPDLHFTANYDTKALGPYAPYYAWRVDRWNKEDDQAWEVTLVHHRLFLSNNPPEIEFFAIHYGYTFVMGGRAWKRHGFVYHADGGVLVCNPSNTVRGKTLNTRRTGFLDAEYRLAGVGAEFAVSRDYFLTDHFFLSVNGALMAGRANVPVVDGSASVPNFGMHGQVGAGFRF